MTFEDVLNEAVVMLQRQGGVSYRALKRQLDLDDDYLEDLKDAILFAHPVADEAGCGLVWAGTDDAASELSSTAPSLPQQETTPEALLTQREQPVAELPSTEAERRQFTIGLKELEEAHKLTKKTGLCAWESYLYWSKGELLLAAGNAGR